MVEWEGWFRVEWNGVNVKCWTFKILMEGVTLADTVIPLLTNVIKHQLEGNCQPLYNLEFELKFAILHSHCSFGGVS